MTTIDRGVSLIGATDFTLATSFSRVPVTTIGSRSPESSASAATAALAGKEARKPTQLRAMNIFELELTCVDTIVPRLRLFGDTYCERFSRRQDYCEWFAFLLASRSH